MTFSEKELQALAELAYLDSDNAQSITLANDVNAILNFIQQLQATNTHDVTPLFHPHELHQRLRQDEASEEDCSRQLAAIAPLFDDDDGLYLVPKVLDSGN